eukprot:761583-Hanusia_phi.AAC.3
MLIPSDGEGAEGLHPGQDQLQVHLFALTERSCLLAPPPSVPPPPPPHSSSLSSLTRPPQGVEGVASALQLAKRLFQVTRGATGEVEETRKEQSREPVHPSRIAGEQQQQQQQQQEVFQTRCKFSERAKSAPTREGEEEERFEQVDTCQNILPPPPPPPPPPPFLLLLLLLLFSSSSSSSSSLLSSRLLAGMAEETERRNGRDGATEVSAAAGATNKPLLTRRTLSLRARVRLFQSSARPTRSPASTGKGCLPNRDKAKHPAPGKSMTEKEQAGEKLGEEQARAASWRSSRWLNGEGEEEEEEETNFCRSAWRKRVRSRLSGSTSRRRWRTAER